MATTREQSERNRAAADYLQQLKIAQHPRITLEDLATRAGIPKDSLNRKLNNRAVITMDDFINIATALKVPAATAFRALAEIVEK